MLRCYEIIYSVGWLNTLNQKPKAIKNNVKWRMVEVNSDRAKIISQIKWAKFNQNCVAIIAYHYQWSSPQHRNLFVLCRLPAIRYIYRATQSLVTSQKQNQKSRNQTECDSTEFMHGEYCARHSHIIKMFVFDIPFNKLPFLCAYDISVSLNLVSLCVCVACGHKGTGPFRNRCVL